MPELLTYQKHGVEVITRQCTIDRANKWSNIMLANEGRVILAANPGSGKTLMALTAFGELCPHHPLLVICTRNAVNTWLREIEKWDICSLDKVLVLDHSNPRIRADIWDELQDGSIPYRIVITTYDKGRIDLGYKDTGYIHGVTLDCIRKVFGMIVFDECRYLRNRKTKNSPFWIKVARKFGYCIFMDGTLISKGPQDLYVFMDAMNILKQKDDAGYWDFVKKYCLTTASFNGGIYIGPAKPSALPLLQGLKNQSLVLIEDDDIAKDRQPLRKHLFRLDMDKEQMEIYVELLKKAPLILENKITPNTIEGYNILFPRNEISLNTMLRQLLVCPKLLDERFGYGAGIEQIIDDMETYGTHVAIFTPYKEAIPYIKERIHSTFPKVLAHTLVGGTSPTLIKKAEEDLNNEKSENCVICSIGFAASFEFTHIRNGYFLGYDYTVEKNKQAQDRLHRVSTKFPVDVYYLQHRNSIDEKVMRILDMKTGNIRATLDDYEEVLEALQKSQQYKRSFINV